jgi:hypothetical protein
LKATSCLLAGALSYKPALAREGIETERTGSLDAIEVDDRYSQDQLEALFRQARTEDVEAGGRFDTGPLPQSHYQPS